MDSQYAHGMSTNTGPANVEDEVKAHPLREEEGNTTRVGSHLIITVPYDQVVALAGMSNRFDGACCSYSNYQYHQYPNQVLPCRSCIL